MQNANASPSRRRSLRIGNSWLGLIRSSRNTSRHSRRLRGNNPMRYLAAQELLMLHARVVDATGGVHGVRDVGLLQSIIVKPSAQFKSSELYPSIFKKAAVLLEAIANYHVFVDGNKRTAFMAAAYFLHIN